MAINIRHATPSDSEACGRIIFEAFENVAREHGFAPDFPSPEAGIQLSRTFISDPNIFAVVAEENGRVVGSLIVAHNSLGQHRIPAPTRSLQPRFPAKAEIPEQVHL